MPAESVGQIGLDLVVNKNGFEKQMAGINNLAKKAGLALAAAFAVKKLVNFGKACLDLGSDLNEVQNVVDVTFPNMTQRLNDFAKNAIMTSGLSETMAKRFTGTFGAMAKSFGFTEQQAYDMSTSLTTLAGDIASFYNISQDAAYTKLKSVFTGETESLKELGVVMTQTALDSYAMANGFGKTTQQMSEAEKVALRYSFVTSKLSTAQGDFARTSGSWANQVRILKLQVDGLKATIGQGLINLFTPIIRVVNTLLGKLATLANAFKSFTELITGNKSSGSSQISSMGDAAVAAGAGMDSAAESADNMAASNDKIGKSAKKAAKEMRSLMGFDKINKLDNPADDSDTGSGGGGGGTGNLGSAVDFGNLAKGENVIEKTNKQMSALLKRCKELAALFKKGFKIGFGDSEKKIKSITGSLKDIKKSLLDIFTDTKVVAAANQLADSIALALGKVTGSAARIGLTIADNLIGGFSRYLNKSKDFIKQRIVSIFDVSSEIATLSGNLWVAMADIFDVFSSDEAKGITADIIGIFSDGFIGVLDLGLKFVRDLYTMVVTPLTENVGGIKEFLMSIIATVQTVLDTLYNAVQATFQKVFEVYDEHVKPFFDSIAKGLSEIVGTLLEAWNTYIAPILQELAEKFDTVWKEHIQPALDSVIELFGNIITLLQALWENILVPFIDWIIETIGPVVGKMVEDVGKFILDLLATVADIFGGITDVLNGFVVFLTGVFTGDNEKAWEGIELIVEGFKKALGSIFKFIQEKILQPFLDFLKSVFEYDWSQSFGVIGDVLNGFFDTVEEVWGNVKGIFNGIIEFIKGVFTADWGTAWQGIQDIFGNIFEGLINLAKRPLNAIIDLINGLVDKLNGFLRMASNALSFDIGFNNPFNGKRVSWKHTTDLGQIEHIPPLAQGGFVRKNTPQLAMIGDNRHQGEVVAPEDKLRQMAMEAIRAAGSSGITRDELERIINNAVMRIITALADMGFYLDGAQVAKANRMAQEVIDIRYNTVGVK